MLVTKCRLLPSATSGHAHLLIRVSFAWFQIIQSFGCIFGCLHDVSLLFSMCCSEVLVMFSMCCCIRMLIWMMSSCIAMFHVLTCSYVCIVLYCSVAFDIFIFAAVFIAQAVEFATFRFVRHGVRTSCFCCCCCCCRCFPQT